MDVLIVAENDWANVGYALSKSLQEVGGDAVTVADPYRVDDIKMKMIDLLHDMRSDRKLKRLCILVAECFRNSND